MDGITVVYTVLSAFAGLTALVPADDMTSDDVLPQGTTPPALQLELVSSFDRNIPSPGGQVHVQQRIRIRIHAINAQQRAAVRAQVRAALFAGRFPVVAGLTNVTVHTDGEGPDGLAPESSVRVGIQDALVTYSQAR